MKWIGVLITFLAFFGDIQLIIMGTLPLIMSQFLWLTGTDKSTFVGVIAGIVAAVEVQVLKTTKDDTRKELVYIYPSFCRRLFVCIAGFVYFIAIIITLVGLISVNSSAGKFWTLMKKYHTECTTKELVDNIQFVLQCCGEVSHQDWFAIGWDAYSGHDGKKTHVQKPRIKTSVKTRDRQDAVPFSCCARSVLRGCVHQNLRQLGTSTINHCGCDLKLLSIAQVYLSLALIIYSVSLGIEIGIFLLLKSEHDSENNKNLNKGDSKFGEFSNNKTPSSQLSRKSTSTPKSTISLKSASTPKTRFTT